MLYLLYNLTRRWCLFGDLFRVTRSSSEKHKLRMLEDEMLGSHLDGGETEQLKCCQPEGAREVVGYKKVIGRWSHATGALTRA